MQITTVSLYRFSGFADQFWALRQMGLMPRRLGAVPGLRFLKLLGSGANDGFSMRPNWSVYSILAVWEGRSAADAALEELPMYRAYAKRSSELRHIFLVNTMAHGLWDGQKPFTAAKAFDAEAPTAVLTRATIRKRHLWRFWREVPEVSRSVYEHPGLECAIGIGELPWVQQATFSLWRTGREMMDFAYRNQYHQKVVAQTRALGWYREELFARFEVIP